MSIILKSESDSLSDLSFLERRRQLGLQVGTQTLTEALLVMSFYLENTGEYRKQFGAFSLGY